MAEFVPSARRDRQRDRRPPTEGHTPSVSPRSARSFDRTYSRIVIGFLDAEPGEFDAEVVRALGRIGRFLDVDQCFLALGRRPVTATHQWRRPDCPDGGLDAGRLIREALETEVRRYEGRSVLVRALFVDDVRRGCLGFVARNRERLDSAEVVRQIDLFGEFLGRVMVRRHVLQDSEDLLRSTLHSHPNRIVVLDQKGDIVVFNDAWQRFIVENDLTRGIRVGANYIELCQEAAARNPAFREGLYGVRAVLNGERRRAEYSYEQVTDDGPRWFVMLADRLRRPEGGVVIWHQEVTELKLAQRRLQDLSGRLIRAQEEERRRIARDLHDGLNQQLAAISMELGNLRSSNALPQELREGLASVQARTVGLSQSVRRISHQLHPSTLEHLGLVRALRNYCAEFERLEGVPTRFSEVVEAPEFISPDVAICLYRVAQEALRNVARHSGADQAYVHLRSTALVAGLIVEDSGRGFDAERTRRQGSLGLVGMEERVRLLNGEFLLDSTPGGGTVVEARIPLVVAP